MRMSIRKRFGRELVLVGLVIALGAVAWDLAYVLQAPETAPHDEGALMAHNAAATVVTILGVVLAALGARMLLLETPATRDAYALFAASTLMLADGVLHFYVVSEHLAILPFAAFFVAAGAVQLALAVGLMKPRPLVGYVAVLVTIGLIGLFFLARTVTMPFAEGPEEYDAVGIVSKVLEFATLGALGVLLYRWRVSAKAEAGGQPGP